MITQIMQTPRLGAELGVHPLWRRPAVVAAASCLAVLLVLLVGLVAAAPARAATGDFEFVGRGYGHGGGRQGRQGRPLDHRLLLPDRDSRSARRSSHGAEGEAFQRSLGEPLLP